MAVRLQMGQGEQAATTAFRVPSALRRGASTPSVSALPSILPTLRVAILGACHPRALVRLSSLPHPLPLLPTAGSISSLSLTCTATSWETSLTPPLTHRSYTGPAHFPLTPAPGNR